MNSYYFDANGDTPFLRPTSSVQAWHAARTFPLEDYRFEERLGRARDCRGVGPHTVARGCARSDTSPQDLRNDSDARPLITRQPPPSA